MTASDSKPPSPSLERTQARLAAAGQDHLLGFFDDLDRRGQETLLAQIDTLDLHVVPGLVREYVLTAPQTDLPDDLRPAAYYPVDADALPRPWDPSAARAKGESLLRAGKVAAFTVAGGQGSRLGYEGPKGCYPAGAVTGKPLFQVFAEGILAAERRYSPKGGVPWYIMTSPLNHAATVAFFKEHRHFGLRPEDVNFFPQGVLPSFDLKTGKILLAGKGEVATNPDGHGGAVKALHASGAIDDMDRRGVEHLSYFQVDNPIVRILDPVFLGLHAGSGGDGMSDSSGEMSSKMVPKADAGEKVGVFCEAGEGGRVRVIEYSDLPERLIKERLPDGTLRFTAGSIAVHAISVTFLRRLATDPASALPYHRAEKKVPHIDLETGSPVTPGSNNAVKLERFIFDALPLCRRSIVVEARRVEEFAPIKNSSGTDSPESSRKVQTLRAARWLEAAGVEVPWTAAAEPDCVLEIGPLTATAAEELRDAALPATIVAGAELAL